MNTIIPNNVIKVAADHGCNHVEYVDKINENKNVQKIYSINEVDDDGYFVPTGLTVPILWNGKEVEEVVTDTLPLNYFHTMHNYDANRVLMTFLSMRKMPILSLYMRRRQTA